MKWSTFAVALLCACTLSTFAKPPKVFILAEQSNMDEPAYDNIYDEIVTICKTTPTVSAYATNASLVITVPNPDLYPMTFASPPTSLGDKSIRKTSWPQKPNSSPASMRNLRHLSTTDF